MSRNYWFWRSCAPFLSPLRCGASPPDSFLALPIRQRKFAFDRARLTLYALRPAYTVDREVPLLTAGRDEVLGDIVFAWPETPAYVHGGAYLSVQPSVLIVDESAETREVLRTALERRGTRILEAAHSDQGLRLVREHDPSVIVVDAESQHQDRPGICEDFRNTLRSSRNPVVVLGSVRRDAAVLPTGQFVAKPYHYGPLIRKIEELLAKAG